MAEDWLADVRKYHSGADEGVVRKIVNYLGIALRNRDSSLVSFSDPAEVGRVRERFLRKKLGLTDTDATLNAGLDAVKQMMSGDRTRNRVTVYYLLADYFGKQDLFGGAASAPGGFSFGAAGAAAAGAAAGAASLAGISGKASAATPASAAPVEPVRSVSSPNGGAPRVADNDDGGGFPGWLKWMLIGAAILLALLLLKNCMGNRDAAPVAAPPAVTTSDATAAAPAAEAAIPTGSGVVAGMKDEKPMATVYFDSGKSDVSNDLAAAAATLKAYLDGHPGAKLAVSGYNDPSGNAAANALLSKKRAQGVAAALKAAGVPDAAVELVKPSNTTTTTVTPEQARRVEVTVQ